MEYIENIKKKSNFFMQKVGFMVKKHLQFNWFYVGIFAA